MRRRTIALLSILLALGASACFDDTDESTVTETLDREIVTENRTADSAAGTTQDTADAAAGGAFIRRSRRSEVIPMGDKDTWTIFVYLCGADLESENAMGSIDIEEMIDSSANDNVRFVVQTGGASEWYLDIDPDSCERLLICSGEAVIVDSCEDMSMGKGSTLRDFLEWGVSEYPAEKMGLVLWDHGSGSINGVCFDERYDNESLLLGDIDAALYSVRDKMTDDFEFIGFDACLMATAEAAGILASHARYMVASQESEPGYGWDYTAIGNYLSEEPSADGAELGRVICDSFYSSCEEAGCENSVTLSVVDLGKIDAFLEEFDRYSKELYELTDRSHDFASFARSVSNADNFGGNSRLSGFTNMVDAGGIMDAGASCASASGARKALESAVIYRKNGSDHRDACGLSMYYPLCVSGSRELSIYKDIALSPYYLGLVDKIAYGTAGGTDISGYDNSSLLDIFSNDWSGSSYEYDEDGSYYYEYENEDVWGYADDIEMGSMEIGYETEPGFDENGSYYFIPDENSLNIIDYVEAAVYLADYESMGMLELGFTGEVYMDPESGAFFDAFDGYWFSLPDDQLIAAYLYEPCDGYDIYISPIKLNGESTYLRFVYDYENTTVEMIDTWDGVSENGAVGRTGTQLKDGDVIVPVYTAYDLESDDTADIDGDEYVYSGDSELCFSFLPDSDYMYSFCINDIYGNYCMTDPVTFTVEGDRIYFEQF